MTLVTTTPGGRALVLTALKRTRLRRMLDARRRDVARCFPDERDPATEATATGPERSEAARASAPTDYKAGGPMAEPTEHTPGPWAVDVYEGGGCDGNLFVYPEDNLRRAIADLYMPMGDAKANAHLIAAAPELLEALETVMRLSGSYVAEHPVIAEKARAAIAKARGTHG